jgi:hypothetical protein
MRGQMWERLKKNADDVDEVTRKTNGDSWRQCMEAVSTLTCPFLRKV